MAKDNKCRRTYLFFKIIEELIFFFIISLTKLLSNIFSIVVTDKKGTVFPCEPESISILGIKGPKERLPYDLCVDAFEFAKNSFLFAENEYFAGNYSIADISAYPDVHVHGVGDVGLDDYPNVKRWHDAIEARSAVQRAWGDY